MNKEKVTKRLSNEGFSLVELIIVIAIMAVLVGVITPQYIKYVNKSKVSVDIQTMDSLRMAMNTAILDPTVMGNASISDVNDATNIGTGITTTFWDEVYKTLGVTTTEAGKTGADVLKTKLKYDSAAAIQYKYQNGSFEIILGGNYSGAYAVDLK